MILETHHKFVELARLAAKVAESDADWKTKYQTIFSDEISKTMFTTGLAPDYYDPDTSYKEDVLAFVDAMNAKADEIEKILNAVA